MEQARRFAVTAWVMGPLGLVLVIASVLWLRTGFVLSSVSSESMRPTYDVGDRIVAERVGGDEVERGDLVLYTAPERYGESAVMQRVIGVGGDRVVCCEGTDTARERITVNGKPLSEPYVKGGIADGMHRPYDVSVPEGRLFLLGDHRQNSLDSRFFEEDHAGTVPVGAVMARVTDSHAMPLLLAAATLLGLLLALIGLVFGITARRVRRRPATQIALWPERW
ncbi:signal peptidase I [Streptomyces sp. cf386]|uniref:signal peptidase I n=1 Tax=Streptomyces sp. cf386 TaxID=1761904 RepID=UPI000887D298|nr:signal peptidase I [Streptomyces sp. cf386]SDM84999.1 signal peptidase I [Streptomyces sp. cf386]